MSTTQNNDTSSSKSFKTFDNSGLSPWSNFHQDPLFTIMMELGLPDFFAFSRVCKPWRSLALAHMNKYMNLRQPLLVSFSTDTLNECYLEDFEGKKLKTIVPHSTGSTCVGLTSGYLIFFNRIARDFWLVNPVTSHELHFPNIPSDVIINPSIFRGILVFSPSVSQWVFLFSHKFSYKISFSLSGNQAYWSDLTSEYSIRDIHSFKGKIYTITDESCLLEVRLDPTPTLTLLGMKNIPNLYFLRPEFVNSGKNLYVVNCISACMYDVYETDFERMEWVLTEKPELEHTFFMGDLKSSAAVNPDTWADRRMRFERFGYLADIDDISKLKGRCLIADIWYFPHDCLNINTLQLQ